MKKNVVVFLLTLAVVLSACGSKPTPTAAPVVTEPPVPTDDGSVTVNFTNESDVPLDIFWVDGEQETPFGSVEAGSTLEQGTYATHVWRVRDAQGNLIVEYAAAQEKQQTVNLTQEMVDAVAPVEYSVKNRPGSNTFPVGDITIVNNSNNVLGYGAFMDDGVILIMDTIGAGGTKIASGLNFNDVLLLFDQNAEKIVMLYIVTGDPNQRMVIAQDAYDWALNASPDYHRGTYAATNLAIYSPTLFTVRNDEQEPRPVERNLSFVNKSMMEVSLYWLDYEGKAVAYDQILPDGTSTWVSYGTAAWVVLDQKGNIVLEYIVTEQPEQTITITDQMLSLAIPSK